MTCKYSHYNVRLITIDLENVDKSPDQDQSNDFTSRQWVDLSIE